MKGRALEYATVTHIQSWDFHFRRSSRNVSTRATGRPNDAAVSKESTLEQERSKVLTSTTGSTETSALPVTRKYETYSWKYGDKVFDINYRVAGNGKQPILLIHGFGANLLHFRYNQPILAENENYIVYAIDLLGFGASEKPKDIEYSIELFSQLVQDFILDHRDETENPSVPWILGGNSIGGLTCLATAASIPDSVAGIILYNCSGGMSIFRYSDVPFWVRPVLYVFQKLLRDTSLGSTYFKNFRTPENVEGILRQSGIYGDTTNVNDELLEILLAPADDDGAQDVFLRVFAGDPGPTPYELLPQVSCPILALWGSADPWTPVDTGFYPGNTFAKYNSDFELQILEGAGHCPHDECPGECNRRVLEWIERRELSITVKTNS